MLKKRRERWNIAAAKAELSRVVEQAQERPQILEKRGKPVAVVLSIEQFERAEANDERAAARRRVFEIAAEIRAAGGVELEIPPRRNRPSPFDDD